LARTKPNGKAEVSAILQEAMRVETDVEEFLYCCAVLHNDRSSGGSRIRNFSRVILQEHSLSSIEKTG
jgi:hypothetical protein